jgi:hypothetical protein
MLPKRRSKRVGGMSKEQVRILQKALNNLADEIDEADRLTLHEVILRLSEMDLHHVRVLPMIGAGTTWSIRVPIGTPSQTTRGSEVCREVSKAATQSMYGCARRICVNVGKSLYILPCCQILCKRLL